VGPRYNAILVGIKRKEEKRGQKGAGGTRSLAPAFRTKGRGPGGGRVGPVTMEGVFGKTWGKRTEEGLSWEMGTKNLFGRGPDKCKARQREGGHRDIYDLLVRRDQRKRGRKSRRKGRKGGELIISVGYRGQTSKARPEQASLIN